ncbi:MAG: hypothetical protein J7521_07735 [Caulobacter sp.]|nr:hypothetical protein [Caulobacter sp.]
MSPFSKPITADTSSEPIDFWRAVAQRGVMALGFHAFEHGGRRDMVAELIAPQQGWARKAAHAAIEVHKMIQLEPHTAALSARAALSAQLGQGPAVRELAIYQGLLLERLWREIAGAPSLRLEALAYPHEEDSALYPDQD